MRETTSEAPDATRSGGLPLRVLDMNFFLSCSFLAHHCRDIVLHLALAAGSLLVVKILGLRGDWERTGVRQTLSTLMFL